MRYSKTVPQMILVMLMILFIAFCSPVLAEEEPENDFDFDFYTSQSEINRFLGSDFSDWLGVGIKDYNQLKKLTDQEPEWTIRFDEPDAFQTSFQPEENYAFFTVHLIGSVEEGDYTGAVTCSWNGVQKIHNILIHVLENPDGQPEGLGGFGGTETMSPGDILNFEVYPLPIGWTVSGDNHRTSSGYSLYTEDGQGHFNTSDINQYLEITKDGDQYTVKAVKPGRYRLNINKIIDNFYLTNSQWFLVLNEDGSEPEPLQPAYSFVEESITVQVNQPYTLAVTGENFPFDDYSLQSYYYSDYNWEDLTEYTYDENRQEFQCVTSAPGYYTVQMGHRNYYLDIWESFEVKVFVTDEQGNMPALKEISLEPDWPAYAVVGDSCSPNFWWNETVGVEAVYPCQSTIEVEHNGIRTPQDGPVVFTEKGEYTMYCTLTDALGRTATASATTIVGDPSPLTATDIEITKIQENGEADHDVWFKVNYSGGSHIASFHAQIFAQKANGEWFMTWEQDNYHKVNQHFWLGEDGYHQFKVQITDGESTVEAVSEVFLVGSAPKEAKLILPESLTFIEENAFAGDKEFTKVIAPDELKQIRAGAFAGCTYLREIYLPSGMTFIDDTAFSGINDLIIYSDSDTGIVADFAQEHGYTLKDKDEM